MLMRPLPLNNVRPVPLWQSEEWARTIRTLGQDAEVVPLGSAGQTLVISRNFGPIGPVRFSSRGPLWHADSEISDRVRALKHAKLHVINPGHPDDQTYRAAGYVRLFKPKHVAILPVADSIDAQLTIARQKWRNAARQGLRQTLWISHDAFDYEQHGWIFKEDRKQQRQKGFRSTHPVLTRAFAQANPRRTHVCQAWQGDTPIAAMVFLRHGATMTYHIGWTSSAGRAARAHHQMLLRIAEKAKAWQVTHLDLGLYDPENAPGLARFKRGSGAVITSLGGTWVRNPFKRPDP